MSGIKEILCLPHSHLDIGYTHPQPLLMELQRDYIDQAIDLCMQTANYSEESRFRWTCEATYPVLKWLETASAERIGQFRYLLQQGQMSICALPAHTTPLCNARQLVKFFHPLIKLREVFGIPIQTAINHDVNGQPWPISQMMLDAGVDFYITGINIHFGGIPFPRPAVFRWQTPDERKLLTFQGEHYSLFSQFFFTYLKDTKKMAEGIKEYVSRLESSGYEHDFVYLTATNPPLYDNNCPDWELASLIRQYNEEGHEYKVRFITPEMLKAKVQQIPIDRIPVYSGDWTDYWNFGSGSSARETALNREAKRNLQKAEFLEAVQNSLPPSGYEQAKHRAWWQAMLYDEHTWGASHSVNDPDHPEVLSQRTHKSHMAYEAADLSAYVLGHMMEQAADNPVQSDEPQGIMLVNTAPVTQQVPVTVPSYYLHAGRHLSALRYKDYLPYGKHLTEQSRLSSITVTMPPYSWMKIPMQQLQKSPSSSVGESRCKISDGVIETPYYRLTYDKDSGRIRQLTDKIRGWDMLDEDSPWTLFEAVRETIDPRYDKEERATFFPRDVDLGNRSISVWNHSWKAKRSGAEQVLSFDIEQQEDAVIYVLRTRMQGVAFLEQRITFSAWHPRIELMAELKKEDVRTPESLYFAFPLKLNEGWRSHYDTAGMFVELDKEQLGNVCRDWITVDETVSIYDKEKGITLVCPDAPLVQIGDFHFGKENRKIKRQANPLLLAWPMNNYWDTNFWVNQPGPIRFRYVLQPFAQFTPAEAYGLAVTAANPVVVNAAVDCQQEEAGRYIEWSGEGLLPLSVTPAQNEKGWIISVRHAGSTASELSLSVPESSIKTAHIVNAVEEVQRDIPIVNGKVQLPMKPGDWLRLLVIQDC